MLGLQPRRLVCPGGSNWGDWDPWTATGQIECLGWRAAAGIHLVHMHIYIPINGASSWSAREANRMRLLFTFVCVLSVPVCVDLCGWL